VNGTLVLAVLALIVQGLHISLTFNRAQETLYNNASTGGSLLASKRFDHVDNLRSGRRMLIAAMAIFVVGDVYLAFLLSVGAFTSLLVFGMAVILGLCFTVAGTSQINMAYRLYSRRWNRFKRRHEQERFSSLSTRL
jgi:MFS family permease